MSLSKEQTAVPGSSCIVKLDNRTCRRTPVSFNNAQFELRESNKDYVYLYVIYSDPADPTLEKKGVRFTFKIFETSREYVKEIYISDHKYDDVPVAIYSHNDKFYATCRTVTEVEDDSDFVDEFDVIINIRKLFEFAVKLCKSLCTTGLDNQLESSHLTAFNNDFVKNILLNDLSAIKRYLKIDDKNF